MSQILQLEYACTNAEMDQAQSLVLRSQLGRGSKWRTSLVLLLSLVGMLLAFYIRATEMAPVYRLLIIAGVVAFSVLFVLWKRKSRKRVQATTRVEASEEEFSILGPDSKVTMPWSAFSRCLESPDLFVLLDRPKGFLVVVPKRAFPSESWQTWFRAQANNPPSVTEPASMEPAPVTPSTTLDRITFRVQLGFRDYLDRTVASWLTWGILLGMVILFSGAFLYAAAHPPPNPVHSDAEVFFIFVLPFFLVFSVMTIFLRAFHDWRSHAGYHGAQEIALSENALAFTSTDGNATLPWTTFAHYRETRWSFILWRGSRWALFPKRAFTSSDDLHRCRVLLERYLRPSRWFLG